MMFNIKKSFFLAMAVLSAACQKSTGPEPEPIPKNFIMPDFLKRGDAVAVTYPSYAGNKESVETMKSALREWGFIPVESGLIPEEPYLGKYSAPEEVRAQDLIWALENPDVKAIFCARGGYGTLHLVNLIPLEKYRNNPKWLIGYSDICTLLNAEFCAGVMGIHGAMGNSFALHGGKDSTCTMVRDIITGTFPTYQIPPCTSNIKGTVTGKIIGGNMSTFFPLLGTIYDPTYSEYNLILFLEEIGETYHHLDRMMNILRNNGVLDRVKGIIFGSFTECSPDLKYESISDLMEKYVGDLGIPVCYGFMCGHDEVNFPLIFGAEMTMSVTDAGTTLTFRK